MNFKLFETISKLTLHIPIEFYWLIFCPGHKKRPAEQTFRCTCVLYHSAYCYPYRNESDVRHSPKLKP